MGTGTPWISKLYFQMRTTARGWYLSPKTKRIIINLKYYLLMKKILRYCLVVLMAAFGLSTYAQTDELTWDKLVDSGKGNSYTEFSGKKVTSNAVYAGQMSTGTDKYIQLRATSPAGIITTTSGGKIKSVTIEWNTNTTAARTISVYGKNTAYESSADLYGDNAGELLGEISTGDDVKTLTVSGDFTFIGVRSKQSAQYIDKITIVWEGGGSTITVPTPSISGTTPFTESTEVTITGTPEGGKTYYTTDGSDPTSSSTEYTAAFTITETTTVKAINYDKDGNASSVASKTFTKETIETANTIAELLAMESGKKANLKLNNAVVLYAGTNDIIIKDATGGTDFYQTGLALTAGQVLNGTINVLRSDYNGFKEVKKTDATNLDNVTVTEGTVTPTTTTVAAIANSEDCADLYKLEKVEVVANGSNYDIVDGETTLRLYDQFKLNYAMTAGKYNIVGVIGNYKGTKQFWPTEAPEAAEEITYPEAANIAAVKELASGTTVKVTLTNAVVNYAKDTREIFIEDATGGIELFDLGEDFAFTAGQVLNGTLTAKYTLFRNLPELTAVNGVTNADEITATSGEAPTPIEMTPEEAAKVENTCKLIIVKNITLVTGNSNYYTDADKTLQIYDKFNLGYTPNTESAMDYTGILVPYNDVFELCPTVEPTESASGGGETPAATSVMIQFEESDICTKGSAKAQYANGDFKLNCVDTDASKLEIDANSAYFGTAEDYQKFTHRLKTGGKSGSKNSLSLTIPSDGTLKVYVRTGSNSATDRNIVLTQNDTELYNKVVQEADAVVVTINEKETNIYPVISVAVKAGEVTIGYPVNALNFYAFEFIAGASGIQNVVKPVVENGIRYNLAGQRVDENYKGVVIMNGKKFVVK